MHNYWSFIEHKCQNPAFERSLLNMHVTFDPWGRTPKQGIDQVSEVTFWYVWQLSRKLLYQEKGFLQQFMPFQYSSPVFQPSSPVHQFQTASQTSVYWKEHLVRFQWTLPDGMLAILIRFEKVFFFYDILVYTDVQGHVNSKWLLILSTYPGLGYLRSSSSWYS